jgi:MinD-like ATPase involved in chromosome partitioning or flagellar assembly
VIISIHSFRGGTGKSNTTANIAALLAKKGHRVGVVDTDIQSPGIHILFNMNEEDMQYSLNDYLWGKCEIQQATYDVTPNLNGEVQGKIFLIPSSIKAGEIARILRQGYDVGILNDGFQEIIEKHALDYLLIDTHPGLNEETLLSIAISDSLIVVLRPDQQDYQGTSVTIEVARRLEVPGMMLVVNKVPAGFETEEVREYVEGIYDCQVAAVLPHSEEMMMLASGGIFILQYPGHPISRRLSGVIEQLGI